MSFTPSQPSKFLFNRSFDGLDADMTAGGKVPPPPTYSQAEIDDACALARQEGFAAGELAAQQQQQAHLLALTSVIEQKITQLFDYAAQQEQVRADDIGRIALAITRKILPEMVQAQALDGIVEQIKLICRAMNSEPRLVVRVADILLDPLRAMLDNIIQQQAFAGTVILLADDQLMPGDCRVEWADGGIERKSASIWQQVEQAIRVAQSSPDEPVPSEALPSSFSVSSQE